MINPRRAAVRRRTHRAAGAGGRGAEHPPATSNSAPGPSTRLKRHSKERQKSRRNWFFFGQVKGQVTRSHQKSNFAVFNISFSTNRHITREPEELQRHRKAHSIALLTLFRCSALRFDLRPTVWPPETKNSFKKSFCEKLFFCIVLRRLMLFMRISGLHFLTDFFLLRILKLLSAQKSFLVELGFEL